MLIDCDSVFLPCDWVPNPKVAICFHNIYVTQNGPPFYFQSASQGV